MGRRGRNGYLSATSVASLYVLDNGCTTLSLDSLGQQLPDPAVSDCW